VSGFSEAKSGVLNDLLVRDLRREVWPMHVYGETEPKYTGRVLRPWLKKYVAALNEPALTVRSDGEVPPPGLVLGSMAFRPDAAIMHFGRRLVSFEVKFLRSGQDPTGAFSKALGQALIYKDAGYLHSHVLLFDSVNRGTPRWGAGGRQPLFGAGITLNWYQISPSGYAVL
jgi:hypothetical protein